MQKKQSAILRTIARTHAQNAYRIIYDWLKSNHEFIQEHRVSKEYAAESLLYILAMPPPDYAEPQQMLDVFTEVRRGKLEWAFRIKASEKLLGEWAIQGESYLDGFVC